MVELRPHAISLDLYQEVVEALALEQGFVEQMASLVAFQKLDKKRSCQPLCGGSHNILLNTTNQ